ncbi:MAG: omp-alpha 4 [Firmicutes bacterium]|nr:omp-alpha 4 [Bacillota bacterium]
MKKSLSLILVLFIVFGMAGTVFAANANPFTDVPSDHWAYSAIKKLAKSGVIDGMGDDTFQGNKAMTRYEMAQIVAKAMAREAKADAANRAVIQKLQAEFAAELTNLGVRVSVLEKKMDNFKMTADARVRYVEKENSATNPSWGERWRLALNADVNDKTSFYGRFMVMNHNEFGTTGTNTDKTQVIDAAFTTKNFLFDKTDLTIGRYSLNLGQTTYFAGTSGMTDGVQANINTGKASLMGGYASIKSVGFGSSVATFTSADNIGYVQLNYAFNKNFKMNANYVTSQKCDQMDVLGAGLNAQVSPNLVFVGDYWINSADGIKSSYNGNSDPKAFVARLAYKGANATIPDSWGMAVEYLKADYGSISGDMTGAQVVTVGSTSAYQGVKSLDVQVSYTLAKNITLEGFYQFDMKDPLTGKDLASDKYTRMQINFIF